MTVRNQALPLLLFLVLFSQVQKNAGEPGDEASALALRSFPAFVRRILLYDLLWGSHLQCLSSSYALHLQCDPAPPLLAPSYPRVPHIGPNIFINNAHQKQLHNALCPAHAGALA